MRKRIKALDKAIRRGRFSQVGKLLFDDDLGNDFTAEERDVIRRANAFCYRARHRAIGERTKRRGQVLVVDPVDDSVTIRNS